MRLFGQRFGLRALQARQTHLQCDVEAEALAVVARAIPEAILCATGRPRPELRGLNEQLLRLRDQLNQAETPTAR